MTAAVVTLQKVQPVYLMHGIKRMCMDGNPNMQANKGYVGQTQVPSLSELHYDIDRSWTTQNG